jgi:archaellum component FlaC
MNFKEVNNNITDIKERLNYITSKIDFVSNNLKTVPDDFENYSQDSWWIAFRTWANTLQDAVEELQEISD